MPPQPIYLQLPTERDQPYFKHTSAAEALVDTLFSNQKQGWLHVHGFVVLPNILKMVISPVRQNIEGVIMNLQSEVAPVLGVLVPEAIEIWSPAFVQQALTTQNALNARLKIIRLTPVAHNLCEVPEDYPHSSFHPRYRNEIDIFAGFADTLPVTQISMATDSPAIRNVTRVDDILKRKAN